MAEPGRRVADWLALVCDLMGDHLIEMPHAVIFEQLSRTFDVEAAAYNLSDASGRQSMITCPSDALVTVEDLEDWTRGDGRGANPLVRWYSTTQDPRPFTIDRVPTSIVSDRERARIRSTLRRVSLDQQLAIPYRLSGRTHQAYVLARTGSDFADEDVVLARHVQKVLTAVDEHVCLLRDLGRLTGVAIDVGLTGRETTVLGLVSAGHSTRAIARRLDCSPRTVEKHLERIYRKLGVRDRLNAVRVARSWAVLAD
jgi:DNA-binding CsgD family transcriptional regulator